MSKQSNNKLQAQVSELTKQLKAEKKRTVNWEAIAKQSVKNADFWQAKCEEKKGTFSGRIQ